MEKNIDVLGLGSISVDFVNTLTKWPAEGIKQPLKSASIHDGGLVGTALVAVSRLGGKAYFAGKLGNSELSKRALQSLDKDGINTSFVIFENGAEPIVAFVFVNTENGHRNIFWTTSDAHYPLPDELPDNKWYMKTKVLLIDYESGKAGIEIAKVAKLNNIPVVSDVEGIDEHSPQIMALSTHLVISDDFAARYTGKKHIADMFSILRANPRQTIIVTMGSKGLICSSPEGNFSLPAYKVDVVDTTGCGDTFHGAYALAIAKNMPTKDAVKFASAAAALCATKIGGRSGIPDLSLLQSFMKNNSIEIKGLSNELS